MYHSSDMEKPETIHLSCLPSWVYKNQELRDVIRNEVLLEVRRDEIDDLKQIALSEAAEELQYLCAACAKHKMRPDDPPAEYECSNLKCRSGAMPVCPDCGEVADAMVDAILEESAA